ncbi:MAG: helix-turn-helix domain-containing protein [Chloroflexota bacterium]
MENANEISFGEWLKRQRKAAGWTQEQLARQVNCSTITLRKVEAGERRPSEQMAARLAEIFHVAPEERESFLRFARRGLGEAPALASTAPWQPAAPRSNLPTPVTSLVGREKELADLQGYLQDANIRLVSLVGPPGIGKTRLSVEVGRAALPEFPDGVFFVALAPLNDPALIETVVLQALDYAAPRKQPAEQQLIQSIGDKRMLLIFDNCEHLIEEAARLVSDLLSACPRLKILVTSREALRVPGEWLYPVPALEVPAEGAPVELEAGRANFSALTLFVERARAVRPDFRLTAENIAAVAAICAQLDGLPLAIELLAARIRLMSPQALLEQMSADFVLSADGMRAVPARQKTLNNAIAWSYHALSAAEKTALNFLSVFSGGFTPQAAEAVCAETLGQPAADLVNALADKNLLRRVFNGRGEPRFAMLRVIQQFVLSQLRNAGLEAQARQKHLEYFLQLAEQGAREIRGARQVEWADRLQSEQYNLHAALEWAVASQQTEAALRLLGALGWSWEIGGHYREARGWLERIRTLPDAESHPLLLTRVLNHIGRCQWTQDAFADARALLEESRAKSAALGAAGKSALAEALNWLGLLEIGQNREAARPLLEQSLELNRQCGDEWGAALSTFHLGILESNSGQPRLARSMLEESLAAFERFGDLFFISRVSIFLGYLFLEQEEFEQARQCFERHLELDTQLHFWDGIAEGWRDLGNLFRAQGDLKRAEEYYERGRAVVREHGLVKSIP